MNQHSQMAHIADDPNSRPDHMRMVVQSGMLKTLGINLYTNIGKVLVEFIANAYDSDASKIEINIPYDRIYDERTKLQNSLKEKRRQKSPSAQEPQSSSASTSNEQCDGASAAFDMLTHTLPEEVQIVLSDDGHGMSTSEVQTRFLPLNRNRRTHPRPNAYTESGKRHVMGRKGLGKLAGFGVAQRVTVWTKRKGQTHATIITMDDEKISGTDDLSDIKIPVTYEQDLDANSHGTRITFSFLKIDAFREQKETIEKTIKTSFYAIRPDDFAIYINGELIAPEIPEYEFVYPEYLTLDKIKSGELAKEKVNVADIDEITIKYYVGFRKRKDHLPAKERGARIYCNNRLAAGPTLFDLGTGMHSFHSQDYMECIVEADALDRGSVDIINTSRTQLKEGNEIVGAVVQRVVEIMREAIKAHGRFREQTAEKEIESSPEVRIVNRIIKNLPRKTRQPAKKLLATLAAEFGVETEQFKELVPIVINSMNATDVLSRLIELKTKPETLERIAENLRELAEIEKVDALKHYRGRRHAIQALIALQEKGEQNWNKKQIERELHDLLKANPWLIRPEFSTYITSDQNLNKVVSKLAQVLGVDQYASTKKSKEKYDETRPDLVFVMSDPLMGGPHVINVVELKSPSKPLTNEHYMQLDDYIFKIRQWCEAELNFCPSIRGFLIGAMPDTRTSVYSQKRLLSRFQESGPNDNICILGLRRMINDALTVHSAAIETLEQDLDENEKESDATTISLSASPTIN